MDDLNFQSLMDQIDFVANYTEAVMLGNNDFLAHMPMYFKQTVDKLAAQKLHHTAENFKGSVDYKYEGDLFIATVDPNNWLAVSVEAGLNSWPMVNTHLKSSKAKTSKTGHKYMIIPLRMWTTNPTASTAKGKEFYAMLAETLRPKPKFFPGTKTYTHKDGRVDVRQEVMTKYNEIRRLERIKQYRNMSDYLQGKSPTDTKYTLFRTMSEKYPNKWVHPGIAPANILNEAKTTVEGNLDQLWEDSVQTELQIKGF